MRRLLPLCLAAFLAACGSSSGSGGSSSSTSSGGASSTATAGGGGTGGSASSGGGGTGGADVCSPAGAFPIPGGTECSGDPGKRVFRFAACSCGDLATTGAVATDSFDSRVSKAVRSGGAVGANGSHLAAATATVKGGLVVAGALTTAQSYEVVQDLWCGGTATIPAPATADSDAYLAGAVVSASPELTIKGRLHTPIAANSSKVTALGGSSVEPVTVAPPCDCQKPIDVAGTVAAFKGDNDNAAMNLSADALSATPDEEVDITFVCGRYFLSGIHNTKAVHLRLLGRTVLAVEGDVDVSNVLTLELSLGAELDLYVTGNLSLTGNAAIGSQDAPATARIYGGGSLLTLGPQVAVGANLYFPGADFAPPGDLELWGSVLAKSITTPGKLTVHYDESVVAVNGCQPKDAPCTDCRDCGDPQPACGASGTCGACAGDKDCCAPMVCKQGSCLPPDPK